MAKKMERALALILLFLMLVTVSACDKPQTDTSSKEITVTVVFENEETKEFVIETEAQYLAEALAEKKIIEYQEDGYYTTVDGVTADYSVNKSWWCLTQNGKMSAEGFNTQPIADGDRFEITYTIG